MFQLKYNILSTIRLLHPYYKDGISRDFIFQPLPETQALFRSYDMISQVQAGQFLLYRRQNEDGSNTPFQAIDEPLDLFFTIQANTDILNITSTIFDSDNKVIRNYWFTNLKADGSYKSQLTENTVLSQADKLVFDMDTIKDTRLKNRLAQLIATKKAWGILHLQLVEGNIASEYNITLPHKQNKWYYVLQEPLGKDFSGHLFDFDYVKEESTSRYPNAATFNRLNINLAANSDEFRRLQAKVRTLQNLDKVNRIYVYESQNDMGLFEEKPPKITLQHDNKVLARRLGVPARADMETIVYHIL